MPRAVSPVVGVVLLIGLTLAVGTVVGVSTMGLLEPVEAPTDPVMIAVSATAADSTIVLSHESGPPIDVRRVTVHISVGGESLRHQPPVPFFSAVGFRSGPTGPFNPSTDPAWSIGERASLRIAGTNDPPLREGVTVTVRIHRGDRPVARAETVAR